MWDYKAGEIIWGFYKFSSPWTRRNYLGFQVFYELNITFGENAMLAKPGTQTFSSSFI